MKKTIFGIVIMSLLIASCKKNSNSSGGSWTFNGNSYQAINCIADSIQATLTAVNTVSGNPYSNISISFYNRLPDSSATYRIAKEGNVSPGHLGISVAYQTSSTTTYYGSSGDTSQRVNVTVTNGMINVSGSNIQIINLGGNTDTSKVTFNISQTQ